MGGERKVYEVKDLIDSGKLFVGDGYRAKNVELSDTGLPFARVTNVNDGFQFEGADRFPVADLWRVGNKVSEVGDVAFTAKGTVGRFAFVDSSVPRFVYSPQLAFWRSLDHEFLYPRFLYYWMWGREFYNQFRSVASQTDMADYVSLTDQRRMRITLPSPGEQRAIAHILGTLDDRIELNRRMSETLEAIARAIFKSWFVDFGPVRAKAEGRDPGLPRRIAELFPESFEDSELGETPSGWGTRLLGDLLSLDKGLSYKGQFLTDVGVPMVNLGCFLGRGRFAQKAIKNYSGEYQPRHVVRPRDLVLANTDITQKREVLGSPALVPPQGNLNELIFTHHVFAARFHENNEPWKLFVYYLLLQEAFRGRATGFATGTTVLALPRDAILDLRCPSPPLALVWAFDAVAQPLLERRWQESDESCTLAAIRDTLLPKLVSGKLRVQNAKRFLEGALQ